MPFIELQSIDSTNNYARRLISEGLAAGEMAIFAHEQWAGKGQRGNNWLTEKSANIILSIIASPSGIPIEDQFALSCAVAVGLHDFFSKLTRGDCSIKWPNDLYWQDRKAGGILIENMIRGDGSTASWDWTIIGIGVNINQERFSPVLKNPVSLRHISGKEYDPVALAKELANEVSQHIAELKKSGAEPFLERYNQLLYQKGRMVRFRQDNRVFQARVKSVNKKGMLIVQNAMEEEFSHGELEWLG